MDNANKKPLGLALIGVILLGILLFFITDGKLNLSTMSKTRGAPTDKEENMAYNDSYRSLSENVLERDGIILRAEGDELIFYALAGKVATSDGSQLQEDMQYTLASISERSELDIEQISEYMGYFYMYDGKDVWRIHTTNPELKLTIENCLKFEPMGNYLYSIKERDGDLWLHRCMVTGADEEYMFKESFVDMYAHSGDLLLEKPDGSYMWYDVVTKNSFDRTLPQDAEDICLYNQVIYYLRETKLCSSHVLSTSEDIFVDEAIADYCIGEGYCAYITEDGRLCVINMETKDATEYSGMEFAPDFEVDVSRHNVFVTDTEGRSFYSPLTGDSWAELFTK